jgi:UPF0755 protein
MAMLVSLVRGSFKLIIFLAVIAVLAIAGFTIYRMVQSGLNAPGVPAVGLPGEGSGDLSPAERTYLTSYLALHDAELKEPAGSDDTPIKFTVEQGDSARTIAARLQDEGLISNAELFRYYMRYHGLDLQIEAGDFLFSQTMTIPDIAEALGRALSSDIAVTIIEGWRTEQVGEVLSSTEQISVTFEAFMALTGPGADLSEYDLSFVAELPEGASLEGFLFPDTYLLPRGAEAEEVVQRFLANFDEKVTPELRAQFNAHGLSLYEAVTLASIVEREAQVDEERPLIASVYLNRFGVGMKLDADPTVQYALGQQADSGDWWKRPLLLEDLQFESPYNTYLNPGLPPGPIANPGLEALQSVAEPAETDYMFFRATCDGSGKHNFATTFEEHNANACPEGEG